MSAIVCIQKIIAQTHKIELDNVQANTLWKAARADLNKRGCRRVVKEVKEASAGVLDTMEREILMDSMGRAMTGKIWPCHGDSDVDYHLFHERVFAYMRSIGAITAEQDRYLMAIETLVEVDDSKGMTIRVQKRKCGLYDIARKIQGKPDHAYEVKHPNCSADDAIRALGHYLHF